MSPTQLESPPLLWVRWDCRRCGHKGGVARTTMPIVDTASSETYLRALFDHLRLKLVKIHQRHTTCIATPDDFVIYRGVPDGKTLEGYL